MEHEGVDQLLPGDLLTIRWTGGLDPRWSSCLVISADPSGKFRYLYGSGLIGFADFHVLVDGQDRGEVQISIMRQQGTKTVEKLLHGWVQEQKIAVLRKRG